MKIEAQIIFDEEKRADIVFQSEIEDSEDKNIDYSKLVEIIFFNLYCSRLYFVYDKMNSSLKNNLIAQMNICGMSIGRKYTTNKDIKNLKSINIIMVFTFDRLESFAIKDKGFRLNDREIDEYNVYSIEILFNYLINKRIEDKLFYKSLSLSTLNLADYLANNNLGNEIVVKSISIAHDSFQRN